MEIDKNLLYTMIREYWSIDNNPLCHDVSILALKKMGFTQEEIKQCLHDLTFENKLEAEEALNNALKETKDYYLDDDDDL